jgi:hypothetical protein
VKHGIDCGRRLLRSFSACCCSVFNARVAVWSAPSFPLVDVYFSTVPSVSGLIDSSGSHFVSGNVSYWLNFVIVSSSVLYTVNMI